MALDISTFKTRALTALIFVVVMLGGLLFHPLAFRVLMALIMAGCGYEFVQIVRLITQKTYASLMLVIIPYIILPMVMLYDLGMHSPVSSEKYSPLLPCGIIFSIWINDTMAYIVGSLIGRTPLSKVSPKKTIEGTLGGIVLAVATITFLGTIIPSAKIISGKEWAIISLLCAVMGTLGDLIESKLKRTAGIKDSGSILPGHGGFLDRFDSLLLAVPAVWIYVKWLM